jgi:hypothetical protein
MNGSHQHLLTLRLRVQKEFQELPGLRLTRWQAARLWHLDVAECDQLLSGLVAAGVLRETPDGFIAGEFCRPVKSRTGAEPAI